MSESKRKAPLEALKDIEVKWRRKWDEAEIFNAEPDPGRPKFFGNYPYSYMNGRPHVGHMFTLMRVEIFTRYKRMKGCNVLFPFAFHWTGTPIVAAALRVKGGEPGQIEMLRQMGVAEDDIKDFAEPLKWVQFFSEIWEREVRQLGMGIDWRRKFHTTEHNPHYDRFVKWQFGKLREKGYIALGSHPVIWCPRCNAPVGDHDRVGGEDERITPVEYTLLKFRCGDFFILAATLRPETVFGQTNLWVDPEVEYVMIKVGGETWVVSRECAEKLLAQGHEVSETGILPGKELVGRMCSAPGIDREILVLPSKFCDADTGTGIVTSVPSDAPDDWMALSDLQKNPEECRKFGLDPEEIGKIMPIPIIRSKELGELPAVDICRQLGVKDQTDKEKLKKAKETVYRAGFYTGVMNENCREYSGMSVAEAKDAIKKKLIEEGKAGKMWEPSAEVQCRCLTKAAVRLVKNQWFITYGNREWKELALAAFGKMRLYPELVRRQFEHVVGWLGDWACTREYGLGTRLPWDDKWVIESLSDSTIYMAYYTIAKYFHHLKSIDAGKLGDDIFDYVFLGRGELSGIATKSGISADLLKLMRDEFEYWYPFDFRNSGKDLVQNHLTFCVFNHAAIFPPGKWPRGFGVNGWITVGGAKMSKSQGTSLFLSDALERFGADSTRLALGNGGEGLDDPSFDVEFAGGAPLRLVQWLEFATSSYDRGRDDLKAIDRWFESRMNEVIRETTAAMEDTKFRTALKCCYFDMQSAYRWYVERCGAAGANKNMQNRFIEVQTLLLAPFVPHVCEEIWEVIGREGYISVAPYPECDEKGIDAAALVSEEYLKAVMDDTAEILKIFRGKPKKIVYYTSPAWKRKLFSEAVNQASESRLDAGILIKAMMADPAMKPHAKEIPKYAQKCIEDLRRMGADEVRKKSLILDELSYINEAKPFIELRLGPAVEVHSADKPGLPDPAGKAKQAVPWRPGIYVE